MDDYPEEGGGGEALCPECGDLPHQEGCSLAGQKLCMRCERQEVEGENDFCSDYCAAKWAEDNDIPYISDEAMEF